MCFHCYVYCPFTVPWNTSTSVPRLLVCCRNAAQSSGCSSVIRSMPIRQIPYRVHRRCSSNPSRNIAQFHTKYPHRTAPYMSDLCSALKLGVSCCPGLSKRPREKFFLGNNPRQSMSQAPQLTNRPHIMISLVNDGYITDRTEISGPNWILWSRGVPMCHDMKTSIFQLKLVNCTLPINSTCLHLTCLSLHLQAPRP